MGFRLGAASWASETGTIRAGAPQMAPGDIIQSFHFSHLGGIRQLPDVSLWAGF